MRWLKRHGWLVIVVVVVGTAPVWLWGLDNLFHFGYGGD